MSAIALNRSLNAVLAALLVALAVGIGLRVAGMGTTSLGTFAANETHRYQFVVTFPDGGTGGADNSYQGAQTSVDYNFTATA
jgi:hypothetical protein